MSSHNAFKPGTVLMMVGTKRGLFLLSSTDRERWDVEATALKGTRIYNAALDQRDHGVAPASPHLAELAGDGCGPDCRR